MLAIIIGIVFLLAGLFKLLDPVGAGLVVEEYFRFLHLGFLMPAAKVTGVTLALGESLIGAALISGIWGAWRPEGPLGSGDRLPDRNSPVQDVRVLPRDRIPVPEQSREGR